ncbi:MAG TPA: GTPase HflX [Nitrospiria bacterium]|nr:GTPase HflX [Nitrospiria bacterium]
MRFQAISGNIAGLKASQLRALERLGYRKIPRSKVITPEAARTLTELSHSIRRQIGLLVDRAGEIDSVIVGNEHEIVIPDLSDYRLGRRRLRGVRCLHTHLKNEPLTRDDLTDLALLRLDLIAAIGVKEDGLPGVISVAHLLPPNPGNEPYEILSPVDFHDFQLDFASFIASLEDELESGLAAQIDLRDPRERAILVSISMKSRAVQEESIAELRELARSDNVLVLETVIQRPKQIHPKYLMGEGKIRELIITSLQQGVTLLIFDQNLSPGQVKAIGEITELKVIDRTQLILDIFSRRAHSRDGKVQVELAQLKYLLPRLSERSTALSRLTGGIGGRGPGETRLEVDRRRVKDKIAYLEKELDQLSRAHRERRSKRIKSGIPIVSIVGYTNAGKSTLLNALTESHVQTQNLLFATLDTTTRRLRFPQEREIIITDTVGFIQDLPPDLLGAFRPTLDELRDADLLIHLVDVSHPHFEHQMEAVDRILGDLELPHIPRLLVFNKEDRMDPVVIKNLCRLYGAISISALHLESLPKLTSAIEERLWSPKASLEDPHLSLQTGKGL